MGNWSVEVYNSIADAETAIELIDSATTDVDICGFLQGAHQQIMVSKAT